MSGFIIAYILIQLFNSLTTDVSFQLANAITVEDSLEKTGYLIRSESVLEAPDSGIVTYAVTEGQKVGSSQIIATVYSSERGVDVQNRMRQIDDKIKILESSTIDTSYLTSDVSKIDAKLYDYLIKIRSCVQEDQISQVFQYKEKLLINFNKRRLITSSDSDYQARIQALRDEKNELTAVLQNPIGSVYSSNPGYFSTLLDGFESVFTIDKVNNLTVDSFHDMIQEKPAEISDHAIGKIVTEFDWYTLCEITKEEAAEFKAGNSYPLYFLYSSGDEVTGILDEKVEQTDTDKVVLKFRIEEVPQEFDFTRQQPVRIIKKTISGLSIPRAALRVVNGQNGVYVINGNTVKFKKIIILHSTETNFICRELNSGDSDVKDGVIDMRSYLARYEQVIVEGKDLYDGKVLE